MRNFIALIVALLTVSCAGSGSKHASDAAQDTTATAADGSKVLVAYFSATGTTKKVAQLIANETGGTLYEIIPDKPYTSTDLDWHVDTSRSTIEMHDEKCRPTLGGEKIDMSKYNVIFLGFPNWWDLPPRQINSFIEAYNLEGKKIIPFMTSGGSTTANSEKSLKALYPNLDWQPAKLLNNTDSLAIWAKQQVK